MSRRAVWPIVFVLGCGPASLDGAWDGLGECDGQPRDLAFNLSERDGQVWSGTGVLEHKCLIPSASGDFLDGCELLFDLTLTMDANRGEQEVNIELFDCTVSYKGDTSDIDCPAFTDEKWDGADRIDGAYDDCNFAVVRVD